MFKIKLTKFQYFLVGGQILSTFIISILIGILLDQKTGKTPLFLIISILISFWSFFILMKRLQTAVKRDGRKNEKKNNKNGKDN